MHAPGAQDQNSSGTSGDDRSPAAKRPEMLVGLSQTLLASVAIMALSMTSGVISARALGPSQKGVLAAAILWPVVLAGLGGQGILDAIVYFAARGRPRTSLVLGTGIMILLAVSLTLMTIGYPLLGHLLGGQGTEVVSLARNSLICIPLILLGTACSSVVIGTGATRQFNTIRCTQPAALCLGALTLVALDRLSVTAFVVVTILSHAFGVTASLGFCLAAIGSRWRATLGTGRLLLTYGTKSHLGHVATTMNLQLDQMMMSALLQSRALGIYAIAVSIGGGVALIAGAAAISSFSKLAAEPDALRQREMFGRIARAGLALALAVAVVLWLAAPRLVLVLFGEAYAAAIVPTRLLLMAAVPLALNTILSSGFKALDRAIVPSTAQVISLVATLTLLPILLPRYEAGGAAATSLIAYSVTTIYLLFEVRRHNGLSPGDLLRPRSSDWQWLATRLSARTSG